MSVRYSSLQGLPQLVHASILRVLLFRNDSGGYTLAADHISICVALSYACIAGVASWHWHDAESDEGWIFASRKHT